MPNNSIYEIRIQLPSDSSGQSAVAQATPVEQGGQTSNSTDSMSVHKAMSLAKSVVAYTGAKVVVNSAIDRYVSTISLRTGATEYEQRLQFVRSEVSQGISSAASILGATAIGGPVGGLVAAVGVGINYLSKALSWSNNANKIRLQAELEDMQHRMMRVRMGTMGSRQAEQ